MDPVNDSPRVLGNRYEVGEILGRGGMAEVHLGRDARLGRSVAIKMLRTDLARDPTFQARFRREAQSAAALNHPAIVAVYDTGEESVVESGGALVSLPYIVMEHIEGRTLRDVLAEGHHLDVDSALDIITGVLTALEYSHRIGIVHRDIKPANVMLTPVGDVKVMDFGIARAMADSSSAMTQTQAVIGTAQYLSPEQARGEQVDTRSDLYSAGCLLFELLTGRPPFVADSPVAVAYQHVREQAPAPSQLVPGIPESVDRIVLHSLAKGREERYQTATDFRNDVEAARGGRQIAVPVMHGSNATTQFVPIPTDATGTRVAPAVGGGLLGDTQHGQQGQDPFGQYGQGGDEYGSRRDQRESSSNRRVLLASLAVLLVVALVGFIAYQNRGNGDPGDTGAKAITMPTQLIGLSQQEAIDKLTQAGIAESAIDVDPVASEADEKGNVIKVDPDEGKPLADGERVTLTVGKGPDPLEMPDVVNLTADAAEDRLEADPYNLDVDREEISQAGATPGTVVRTDPAAKDSVTEGDKVTIFVASASSNYVKVPKVAGQPEEIARQRLETKGFRVTVAEEPTYDVVPGIAIGTNPREGQRVQPGRLITLVIAVEPEAPATSAPPSPTPSPSPSASSDPGDGDPGDTNP